MSRSRNGTGPAGALALARNIRLHYASVLGAQRWLEVCDDPAYAHHRLISRACAAVPRLLTAVPSPGGTLALVSLGPGDGRLDLALLDAFERTHPVASYVGVDTSSHLLALASSRLHGAAAARRGSSITLIEADFLALARGTLPPSPDGARRCFLLLGLTFGNYDERALLAGVMSLLAAGDLLVFDARLHRFGRAARAEALSDMARRTLLAPYDRTESRRFAFAPVEAITTATSDAASIGCELRTAYSVVPGTVAVVSFCEDLETTMRASGEPVLLERLDLGVTAAYDRESLLGWVRDQGFAVLGTDEGDDILHLAVAHSSSGPP